MTPEQQLLHLIARAERCALLPDEAARLRQGVQALLDRISTLEHVAAGNKRHVQMILPDLERATKDAARAERAVARVRARHTPDAGPDGDRQCAYCTVRWPCPTVCLLDGPPCGPHCAEYHDASPADLLRSAFPPYRCECGATTPLLAVDPVGLHCHEGSPAATTPRATPQAAERCPSCEHEARYHDVDGRCWFTVEQGVFERDAVCSCQLRHPDTSARTSADIRPDVRAWAADVIRGQVIPPDGEPVTSTDTVRARPDTDTVDSPEASADTSGRPPRGVRVEYRATVPRHLFGAAVAEGLAAVERATRGLDQGEAGT